MGSLLLNENMKLYRRPRAWVMIGLMAAAVLFVNFVDWYYGGSAAAGESWRQSAAQELEQLEGMPGLQNGQASGGEREAFASERAALLEYRLEHDIRPEAGTMWSGIIGSAGLVLIVTLFAVIAAGDSLAGEFASGTIKLLLIRPASRTKILMSKYFASLLFGLVLVAVLFTVSFLANGLLYRFQYVNLPMLAIDAGGNVVERSMLAHVWQTYLLNCVPTVMYATMAFMISSAFRSGTMAIGLSIFSLFAGAVLLEFVRPYDWSKYLLFANTDLAQHIHGWPYRDDMTLSFSVAVLLAYFAAFHLIAWLLFTKRDVAS